MAVYTALQSKMIVRINTYGENCTFTRDTKTTDGYERITAISSTSDTDQKFEFQPITEEDRKMTGRGISTEGYMRVYAKPSYDMTNNGDNTTIEIGDKITRTNFDSVSYRVEQIVAKWTLAGVETYRILLVRRIDD